MCGDTYASYSINCGSVVVYGDYSVGSTLKLTNYITVPVTVSTAGNYTIIAETGNGYYFEKSGVFASAGTYTLTLSGTGVPTTAGTDTLTFSLSGVTDSSCTSATVTIDDEQVSYIINCNGITVNGQYSTGVMLDSSTNTVTVPLKVLEVGGDVSILTATNNGVRFYSTETITTSSTYITLVGVGTPKSAGTYSYTFKTNGSNPETCTFDVTFITTIGTFSNPANRCKEIYDLGETTDGEYWIATSSSNTTPTKTFCDMTHGGYTLIWSYSENTNYTTYATTSSIIVSDSYRLNQDISSNTVTTESGTMNYYNFRLPLATITNINSQTSSTAPLRVRITEAATDMNDAWANDNYIELTPPSSTESPISATSGQYDSYYPSTGKIFGQTLTITSSNKTYAGATLGDAAFYYSGASGYPNHYNFSNNISANNTPFTSPDGTNTILPSNLNDMFGYFNGTEINHHFGKCGGSTGDETSFATTTCAASSLYPHTSFNDGEGRIMQWFIK